MACCNNFLQIVDATLVQGTTATIEVAPETFSNLDIYSLRQCVSFTDATGAEALQITNGTDTYPVWDRNGAPVILGRTRRRQPLVLRFISTDTAHFTVLNELFCARIETPAVTA